MSRSVSRAGAIALTGLTGTAVMVEAAVSQQLPGIAIIGLPDAAIAEAKLRVRTATAQSDMPLASRFLTVNLQPADLPKQGSGFDLAIALAALAASQKLPTSRLADTAHIGELGLDGGLRRPAGLLAATVAARKLGFSRVMVPEMCSAEASLVPDVEVIAVRDLAAAVAWHSGQTAAWRVVTPEETRLLSTESSHSQHIDMADVIAQPEAVEALTIAAAGRHHVSMLGPPGAGKTMLAARLPSILPDLDPDESLTASSIAALGGAPLMSLISRPPLEAPHHTASAVSIIGGGEGTGVRPGAITRACHGVLFLDEAPEFPRSVLDALRQPLESGSIEIHRARVHASLPAAFQLVTASNPCPCGNAGAPETARGCQCSPSSRMRYAQRLSGPLTDRIDIRLTVRRVSNTLLQQAAEPTPSSEEIRARVTAARRRARNRLSNTPWRTNGEVHGSWLRSHDHGLPRSDTAALDRALARGALTMRGYDRVLRVSWSIADLTGEARPGRTEIARALMFREGSFA